MTFEVDNNKKFDWIFDKTTQTFNKTTSKNYYLDDTFLFFSLFTNIRANNSELSNNMLNSGYIAEMFVNNKIQPTGSKLWIDKPSDVFQAQQQYTPRIKEALQFLINLKLIDDIKIDVFEDTKKEIAFNIKLMLNNNIIKEYRNLVKKIY